MRKLSLLLIVLMCGIVVNSLPTHPVIRFSVKGIGSPDAYGNVIEWLCVYQWNGTVYNLLLNVTSNATWSQRVQDSLAINLTMKLRLNITFASDNSEAISYTKILCNISTIWTNEEFNNTAISSDASYYYLTEEGHWNQTGYPQSGTDYDVETRYEAYY